MNINDGLVGRQSKFNKLVKLLVLMHRVMCSDQTVLRIRDVYPGSEFFISDPGSKRFRVPDTDPPSKNMIWDVHPGSRGLFTHHGSRMQGVKKVPDPGSATLRPSTGTVRWSWSLTVEMHSLQMLNPVFRSCLIRVSWPVKWNFPGPRLRSSSKCRGKALTERLTWRLYTQELCVAFQLENRAGANFL